jgi:hypothetical protein
MIHSCLKPLMGGNHDSLLSMNPSFSLGPFEWGALLSHEHSPFSHSNFISLLGYGWDMCESCGCYDYNRKITHALIVGKIMWRFGDSLLML